ncbi:MAG: PAS domain S-box protein, partial [Deltaproteobacteria bacterium]|nr:PAS domain S-box protein [Deltaproteobacteria bacterium]
MRKNLATIALTLVFLFAVVFLAFHLHQTSRGKILSQFNERQLQAVRQVTLQIESYLKGRSQDALWLSSFPSLKGRTAKRMPSDALEYFNRLKHLHVTEISVIDDKGTVVFSTTAGAVGWSHPSSALLEWAGKTGNRKSVRLITARKSSRSTTGTDKSPVQFQPNVLLVTPMYRESAAGDRKPNGKFAGILSLTIDLERMLDEQTLLLLPATKSHPVWIMDTKGTLLLQSEHPEMIMRNLRERDETCNRCHVSFDYVEKILVAEQGTAEYQLRGDIRKIAAFAKMSFGNSTWVVVLNAPYDEVTGFTEENFKETMLMLGIVVLALGVSSFAMYRNYRQKVVAQEEAKHLLEKQTLMENLRETRDYLENLLDNANAPIVVWDPQFRITRFNRAFERLTGRTAVEVLGSPPDVLFPADRREEAMGHIHRTTEGERWETLEIPILHVDGSVRTILWNSATLYSKDGKAVIATIAQGQDITERERAVDQILWNYHTQQALTSILQISLERLSLKEKLEWAMDVLFHVPWLQIESKGCIFLVGKEPETLAMEAHRGLPPEMLS